MSVTSQQYRTALQRVQTRYLWIELLNYEYQTIGNIEGVCTEGSISIDANSDIRRSGNIKLVVKDSSFQIGTGNKIWLDKYVKVYVGVRDLCTDEIVKYNLGLYIIDAPSYEYNPTTNTLSLSLLDLMAKITGVRNGYLLGIPVKISAGENIRQAIISTLALGEFTKYVVEEAPIPVPADLEFKQGSTVYDVIKGLRDIYPNYECFFDVDGVFYYKQIPTGEGSPVLVDDVTWDKILLSETVDTDFQKVKNSVEVYGRTHDPSSYASTFEIANNNMTLNIDSMGFYTEGLIVGFSYFLDVSTTITTMKVNTLTSYPVYDDNGNSPIIESASLEMPEIYCAQFKGDSWYWLGHLQAYSGVVEDTVESSPFNVNTSIGRIRAVYVDGDYANCITDFLAHERAVYELRKATKLQNTVKIDIVPLFFLDVNNVVSYTLKSGGETKNYLIQNIDFNLDITESTSISMMPVTQVIQ